MKRRRTSTKSTPRQRQQWRDRKTAQREREANPLFEGSKRKNPIGIYPAPLPRSIAEEYAAGLTAERGRDDKPMSRREYRRLIGLLVAHDVIIRFKK